MVTQKKSAKDASLGRRSFLKWATLSGGAAALASSSLLNSRPAAHADEVDAADGMVANTTAALSDGLPYGANKIVPTICTCGDACGMNHVGQAYVKDGEVVYYEGCPAAKNKGGLCARGMAAMSIINNPNRIKYPMRRTNEKGVEGEFERISWDEAYDMLVEAMATAIEEEGPQTIDTVTYHHGNYMLKGEFSAFAKIWQTDKAYGPGMCFSDLMVGEATTIGDSYHCMVDDPLQSKLILSWGENDVVAKPSEYAYSFRKAVTENGAKWIQVEPRLSETGAKADLYLPVRPGTDAYLALAMCNVIISEGLQDQDFIDKHTYGYDEFKQLVERYTPEEVEKITWCPAERIRQAARMYATTKPAMLLVGRGGNQTGGKDSNASWLMSRAAICLIGLTGQAGMKGAGLSTEASGQPTAGLYFHWPNIVTTQGHASLCEALVKRDPDLPEGGTWGAAKHLIDREPYGYRVWMGNINPAASSGNTAQTAEALKKIGLVCVLNRLAHWTGSAYADLLIPICSWTEMYCWRPDFQEQVMTRPAIDPLFESVSDFAFFKELSTRLARRLGLDESKAWPWKDEEDFLSVYVNDVVKAEVEKRIAEGRTEFEEWRDVTVEQVLDHPEGMPNPFYAGLSDFVPYTAKSYPELAPEGTDPDEVFFPTAAGGDYPGDGKLLFRCDWISERSGGVLPVMPVPEEPCDSWYAQGNPIESGDWEESDAVKAGYDLVACGKAHTFWGYLSFNQDKDGGPASRWQREAFRNANTPCVEMNPRDAQARGLADGDIVTVESQHGVQEEMELVVTERAMPGVIVPPCHWGTKQCGIYPYSLTFDNLDNQYKTKLNPGGVGDWGTGTSSSMGGQCVQSAVLCKVYKYEG